jgi:beta-glucosidase
MNEVKFPEGFLWGAATAGHQIEGDNIHSQNWQEEIKNKYPEPSGKACNSWELFDEDAKLISELGLQAYRMSIEWSRIQPEEGFYNNEALERYLKYIAKLNACGIKVFITLHHFTHPYWFEKKGGFRERKNVDCFLKYLDYIIPKISSLVSGWTVINEFNLNRNFIESNDFKANMLITHAKAYYLIKQFSDAPVSTAHALADLQPDNENDKFDRISSEFSEWITNEFFFHALRTGEIVLPYRDVEYCGELKGAVDFWALNYYTRHLISARNAHMKKDRYACNRVDMIDKDFYLNEMYPEGLIKRLDRLKDKPVYITENGCSCDDDRLRIIFITRYLHALSEAIQRGVDVRGYFYWSLMDNYEWGSFKPKFGLCEVDLKNFSRTPKESAYYYRRIIAANGIPLELKNSFLNKICNLKGYTLT